MKRKKVKVELKEDKDQIFIPQVGISDVYKTEEEMHVLRTATKGQYRILQTEWYGDEVQKLEEYPTTEQASKHVAELLQTEVCCLISISDDQGNILYMSD